MMMMMIIIIMMIMIMIMMIAILIITAITITRAQCDNEYGDDDAMIIGIETTIEMIVAVSTAMTIRRP